MFIIVKSLFNLLICHLIGDYVLQSNFLATTKGQNWYHLFIHCVLYIVPFYFVFGFSWHIGVLFAVHIIVDTLKARYNKISYIQDQILHYLLLTIYFIR